MSLLPAKILDAATVLARDDLRKFTRDEVAARAGVSQGSVNFHFETLEKLRDAVVTRAISTMDLPILAQAIAQRHPLTCDVPMTLKRKVSRYLTA